MAKTTVHASVFMSGAWEWDSETKKMTPLSDPEFNQTGLVVPSTSGLEPHLQVAALELAVNNLIKVYLQTRQKTENPNMPPALGVH